MGLGTNRDYKTTDRRARKNLAKHAAIMQDLMAAGMDKEAASKEALERVLHPKKARPER